MTSDIGRKRPWLIQIICEEWITAQEYPGTLDSEVVYHRLISEGEHFAEGEMDAVLTHLMDKEQITVLGRAVLEMLLSIHRTTYFATADCNDIDPGGLALRLAALAAGRIANPIG